LLKFRGNTFVKTEFFIELQLDDSYDLSNL